MTRSATQFLISLLLFFILPAALNAQFDSIAEKISAHNLKFPHEAVYVHVDREVYNPGDTIWFKAYLRDQVSLKNTTVSSTLFIKIVNTKGGIIHGSRHPVFNSESLGQIALDEKLQVGFYELICYSSWMKNESYEELYRKTIRVKKETTGRVSFKVRLDQDRYFPGDTIRGTVFFLDEFDAELSGEKIQCRVGAPEILSNRHSIQSSATNNFQLIVTPELLQAPRVELSTVYKGFVQDTVIHLPVPKNFDIGFYPEGGNLVEGLSNRVAFKIHSENNINLDMEGVIYSENGEKIALIKSDHQGMGSFTLIPEPGKKYVLKVSDPPNMKELFPLPEADNEGWILQAFCRKQQLSVSLSNTYSEAVPALITISVRGFLLRYVVRSVRGFDTFSLPTEKMPDGVAVITLFDELGNPRAERLVFINHEKQNKASIEPDRISYLPRDSVSLKIRVRDYKDNPVRGSFSLSVVDEQLCMSKAIDEPKMGSTFYLSPEIFGPVDKPEYYFSSDSPEVHHHLDLLLLTQGWRKYRYEDILKQNIDSLEAPRVQDVVNGQLLRYRYGRKGVPSRGRIRVFNAGGTAVFETDDDGKFRYMHYYHPTLNPNVFLFGEDMEGDTRVEIKIDRDSFEEQFGPYFKVHADSLFYRRYQHPEAGVNFQDQYTLGINNRWIEELIVYGKRNNQIEFMEETFLSGKSALQNELKSAPDVYGVLLNMGLPFREVVEVQYIMMYDGYPQGPVGWYVDDMPRDYDFVRNIWTGDLKALFVVKYPDTQLFELPDASGNSYRVIVSLHMIPFSERTGQARRNNSVILPKLSMSKEFYRPRYDTPALRYSQVPDLRKTLHWEPEVELDENGETTITYYNGDRYTRVMCILEGVSDDGIPVYGERTYNIYTVRE